MKFSVLVPVYNVEKYLPECLESLKNQTYKDFEIILVDDGSTDASGKICDEFKLENQNVIVVHKENAGLISARRVGISYAKGDYCVFCDSDDFMELNALESISKVIDDNDVDLIIYNAYEYDGIKKTPFFQNVLPSGMIANKNVIYDKIFLSYSLNAIWLKAVRRSIIDSDRDYSKFYRCNFGEDLLQSVPLLKRARSIYYLDRCLYNYRIVSGMMHKYNSNYYWSYRKINLDIREQLKDEGIVEFEEKIGFHLIIAAYGGTTQFKYADKFDSHELEKIREDDEFRKAYCLIWKGKYKNIFKPKQKFIIELLCKRQYWIIRLLLSIRRNG